MVQARLRAIRLKNASVLNSRIWLPNNITVSDCSINSTKAFICLTHFQHTVREGFVCSCAPNALRSKWRLWLNRSLWQKERKKTGFGNLSAVLTPIPLRHTSKSFYLLIYLLTYLHAPAYQTWQIRIKSSMYIQVWILLRDPIHLLESEFKKKDPNDASDLTEHYDRKLEKLQLQTLCPFNQCHLSITWLEPGMVSLAKMLQSLQCYNATISTSLYQTLL